MSHPAPRNEALDESKWSFARLREITKNATGKEPCLWQLQACQMQAKGQDALVISKTSSGKTLPIFMPLLADPTRRALIISPLKALQNQFKEQLDRLGITSVVVTAETASVPLFKVCQSYGKETRTDFSIKRIAAGEFRVIVTSPEYALSDPRFNAVWKSEKLANHVHQIVIDEAHCISVWGSDFRPDYGNLGNLRYLLPNAKFYLTTATAPPLVRSDILSRLGLRTENVKTLHRSNDRANVAIVVRKMQYTQKSFQDLAFLVPEKADTAPPKFMAFFNTRKEAQKAAKFLRRRLKPEDRERIVWFHAGMTDEFREKTLEKLKKGEVWGICCTEAAGMVRNISMR